MPEHSPAAEARGFFPTVPPVRAAAHAPHVCMRRFRGGENGEGSCLSRSPQTSSPGSCPVNTDSDQNSGGIDQDIAELPCPAGHVELMDFITDCICSTDEKRHRSMVECIGCRSGCQKHSEYSIFGQMCSFPHRKGNKRCRSFRSGHWIHPDRRLTWQRSGASTAESGRSELPCAVYVFYSSSKSLNITAVMSFWLMVMRTSSIRMRSRMLKGLPEGTAPVPANTSGTVSRRVSFPLQVSLNLL